MALIGVPADHIKLRKTLSFEKKPLMLKDFLLRDDLSSCSSSGFKSFPRQRCCTTVRFLLEAELKKSKDNYSSTTKRLLFRSRSKPGAATISALQRASEVVLNAVKLLPFPSIKSSSSSLSRKRNSSRKVHFTRNFSRKLLKRSFWRKADKEDHQGEIRRCKLFREFLEEKNEPSDQNTITNVSTTDTSSYSSTTITAIRVSSNTSGNSWAESEFTADVLQTWSRNSERSSENDIVEAETSLPQKEEVSNTVGEDSINFTKFNHPRQEQNWPNEEGKEQFSPVSVLDCPFHDEEEDNSSPFQDGLPHVEGTKQKLMPKVRRFESLAQLEPVDLEKRIAMAELEDESSLLRSVSVNNNGMSEEKLLKLLKAKFPSEIFKFRADNLLLDFFWETFMVEDKGERHDMGFKDFGVKSLKVVEDWVNGNSQEFVLGWELHEGRKAYLKDMERNENWRNFNEEKDVGSALELELFSSLVDEVLTDLF
ncbi:UAA transporter [Gossypium australe]|uniref:UAA transporter n=1 Tax=Gossypium australe TaxID=47621 RepID=A0A5B6VIE5_9ROSI|nr:UAA transporter [Gossypium australe]